MLTHLVVWLNGFAGAVGALPLLLLSLLPGWLSLTIAAGVSGVVMLCLFKLTSNQQAIQHTRNQIKADLLSLSLFKDNLAVNLRSQLGLLQGGLRLLLLSLVPMLIMVIPVSLILAQLSVWYQARPLHVGEEAIVTVHLAPGKKPLDDVQFLSTGSCMISEGPVRVPSKQMVCWNIQAQAPGLLTFAIKNERFTKELAVGSGYLPVSQMRPAWKWDAALLHPREQPFAPDSLVQSIEVAYPERLSWTAGTHSWLAYWFIVSLLAAFLAKPWLKVQT